MMSVPNNALLRRGRNPITFHARLAIRIHQHDFRAELFGFVQIFGGDRLIVGRVRAEENDQVRAIPILVTARRRGDADGVLHRAGRGRMAKPRGVIDIVGAEKARGFLRHVINFVRHAARGDEKREALWIAGANSFGDAANKLRPSEMRRNPLSPFSRSIG